MTTITPDRPVPGAVRVPDRVEWPTVAVALGCWGGWVGVLAIGPQLPTGVLVVALAVLGAWYMSLQHEVIHGHPTPWRWLNTAMAWVPLNLWLPYASYRESHLRHHAVELTVPGVDPESFFVTPAAWDAASPLWRLVLRANQTLAGRVTVGAVIGPARFVAQGVAAARRDARAARVWVTHLLAATGVAWVVFAVFEIPVLVYLLGYCWLSMSLISVRSFAEHRAVPAPATRSAVVRSNVFWRLLFLNNNFHHVHHVVPGAPWYRLARLCDEMGAEDVASRGAGAYRGYAEVIRRFAWRPLSMPVFELADPDARRSPGPDVEGVSTL